MRAVRPPVALERDEQLEPELALPGLERPGERPSHVVALGDDELVPLLALRLDEEVRRPGEGKVVLGVAPTDSVGLALPRASFSAASSRIVSSIQ